MVIPDPTGSVFVPCYTYGLVCPKQRSLLFSIVCEKLLGVACPDNQDITRMKFCSLELGDSVESLDADFMALVRRVLDAMRLSIGSVI
jgi:hypothetical protein